MMQKMHHQIAAVHGHILFFQNSPDLFPVCQNHLQLFVILKAFPGNLPGGITVDGCTGLVGHTNGCIESLMVHLIHLQRFKIQTGLFF